MTRPHACQFCYRLIICLPRCTPGCTEVKLMYLLTHTSLKVRMDIVSQLLYRNNSRRDLPGAGCLCLTVCSRAKLRRDERCPAAIAYPYAARECIAPHSSTCKRLICGTSCSPPLTNSCKTDRNVIYSVRKNKLLKEEHSDYPTIRRGHLMHCSRLRSQFSGGDIQHIEWACLGSKRLHGTGVDTVQHRMFGH